MSTKRDPGPYDCYQKLADDEPYFVLRAKDPDAPALVEAWASTRAWRAMQAGAPNPKIAEAQLCARAMREWRQSQVDQGKLPPLRPAPSHGMGAVEHGVDLAHGADRSVERSPDDEAHERPTLKDA